jgi:hypothetical protein
MNGVSHFCTSSPSPASHPIRVFNLVPSKSCIPFRPSLASHSVFFRDYLSRPPASASSDATLSPALPSFSLCFYQPFCTHLCTGGGKTKIRHTLPLSRSVLLNDEMENTAVR